jgi:hypothetical protein
MGRPGPAEPYDSSDSSRPSVCSGSALGSRTSVASTSVTTIAPEAGSSIASTMAVSTAGVLGGFIGCAFLRVTFFAPARLGLALAKDFLGFDLAIVRFAAFPRAELEVLRALPRAADFPLRAVARFFL